MLNVYGIFSIFTYIWLIFMVLWYINTPYIECLGTGWFSGFPTVHRSLVEDNRQSIAPASPSGNAMSSGAKDPKLDPNLEKREFFEFISLVEIQVGPISPDYQ